MDRNEWDAWEAQEPPSGFAERVVAAANAVEARRPSRAQARRVGAGVLLVGAMAAGVAMTVHLKTANAHGDVTATARREVRVGTRAIAVLEAGAHVKWAGDAIAQSAGEVFWRVEPGARFVVEVPGGEVTVKGTCFRVDVREGEDAMNRRDAVAAAVGAAVGATTLVGVYEGKVALAHNGQSVDVSAGESAQTDRGGVHRVGESSAAPSPSAAEPSDTALATATTPTWPSSVRAYRRLKLRRAVEAEKKRIEAQLAAAEAKLGDAGSSETQPEDLLSHVHPSSPPRTTGGTWPKKWRGFACCCRAIRRRRSRGERRGCLLLRIRLR